MGFKLYGAIYLCNHIYLPMDAPSSYHHFSLRDVICGYVCFSGVSERQEKLFESGLKYFHFFPGSRTVTAHRTSKSVIYTNSLVQDRESQSFRTSHFVGYASGLSNARTCRREISSYFNRKQEFKGSDFSLFIDSRFAGVVIDENKGEVHLLHDFFGKRNLFYRSIGDTLYFSSEFQVVARIKDSNQHIDRQALRNFLSFGALVGNQTLLDNVKCVPLQSYAVWDGTQVRIHSMKRTGAEKKQNIDPQGIYSSFLRAVQFFSSDLNMHIADLTGGADSRLTLSAIRELNLSFIHVCDDYGLDAEPEVFYDYVVMEKLKNEFNLDVQFCLDEFRSSRPFIDNSFEWHRHFEGDRYERCLSSLFGGELFGGRAYEAFFSDEGQKKHALNFEVAVKFFPSDYFQDTCDFKDEIEKQCLKIDYSDPKVLLSMAFRYSSPALFLHGQEFWFEPNYLNSRKVSTFISDIVLREMDVPCLAEKLKNYNFYYELYKTCAPDFLRIPFQSYMTDYQPANLIDIKDQVRHLKDRKALHRQTPEEVVSHKISLLKKYFHEHGNSVQ